MRMFPPRNQKFHGHLVFDGSFSQSIINGWPESKYKNAWSYLWYSFLKTHFIFGANMTKGEYSMTEMWMNFSASRIVLTIASKSAVRPLGTIAGGELCETDLLTLKKKILNMKLKYKLLMSLKIL